MAVSPVCPHLSQADILNFEAWACVSEELVDPFSCDTCGCYCEIDLWVCATCRKIFCVHGDPGHSHLEIHIKRHSNKRKSRRSTRTSLHCDERPGAHSVFINCADAHVFCTKCSRWLFPRELSGLPDHLSETADTLVENWLQRYGRRHGWWQRSGIRGGPGIRGLKNFQNTCFFTSTLQALLHCKHLLKALSSDTGSKRKSDSRLSGIQVAFHKLAKNFWSEKDPKDDILIPRKVFKALQNKTATDFTFGNYEDDIMEDSSTLLLDLLNGFSDFVIDNTFGCQMIQSCICRACATVSTTKVKEFTLSLPLGSEATEEKKETDLLVDLISVQEKGGMSNHPNTTLRNAIRAGVGGHLHMKTYRTIVAKLTETIFTYLASPIMTYPLGDLLERYFAHEELTGSDQYECSTCNKKVDAMKRVRFEKPPTVLAIQLRRFQGGQNLVRLKFHDKVLIPETLDLTPYIHKPKEHRRKAMYQLFAANVHEGGMGGGHNMAYTRILCEDGYHWFWFSDSFFQHVTFDRLLQSSPYILFYERISDRTTRKSERRRESKKKRDEIEIVK